MVGWGDPVRTNFRDPDGRWYGNVPQVVLDLRGEAATKAIPKIEAAVKEYQYANAGDYRIWPGPNSNTFVATVLRAIPEAEAILPANAVGRDFRPYPYAGLTDSGTGVEASLWGIVGVKLGWVEGVEMNFLGLVAGLDLRNPGVKLPGFGRIGLPQQTAIAGAGAIAHSLHGELHRPEMTAPAASGTLPACTTPCRCWRKFPFPAIRRGRLDTLQVNVGYRCNQSCVHCHVGASPHRTEEMSGDSRRHRAPIS